MAVFLAKVLVRLLATLLAAASGSKDNDYPQPNELESNDVEHSQQDHPRLSSDNRAAENERSRQDLHDLTHHDQSLEQAQANDFSGNAETTESEVTSWPDEVSDAAFTRGDMILTRSSDGSMASPRLLLVCGVTAQPSAAATIISDAQKQRANPVRLIDLPTTPAYTKRPSEMLVVDMTSQAHKQAAERFRDALNLPVSPKYRKDAIGDILQDLDHLARPLSNVDLQGHCVYWHPSLIAICKVLAGDTCANQYCRDGYAPLNTSALELENGSSAAPAPDVD